MCLRETTKPKPPAWASSSSKTVCSTYSKTRKNRFFRLNTSIRFTRFSWRNFWKREEIESVSYEPHLRFDVCKLTRSILISRMAIFLTVRSSSVSKNFLIATCCPVSRCRHLITRPYEPSPTTDSKSYFSMPDL